MIKDQEYKNLGGVEQIPHVCFWCQELTYAPSWSCRECYPKKEAGYKKAREAGAKTWEEVMEITIKEI